MYGRLKIEIIKDCGNNNHLVFFVFSAFGVNAGAQNIDIPLTDNYNEEKNWGIY